MFPIKRVSGCTERNGTSKAHTNSFCIILSSDDHHNHYEEDDS